MGVYFHCVCAGRRDSTWVAITPYVACGTMKCNVLAYAICGGGDLFVHIIHGDFPVFLRDWFGIVCPHLGNGVGGTCGAWGLFFCAMCGGDIVLWCWIVLMNDCICNQTNAYNRNRKQQQIMCNTYWCYVRFEFCHFIPPMVLLCSVSDSGGIKYGFIFPEFIAKCVILRYHTPQIWISQRGMPCL